MSEIKLSKAVVYLDKVGFPRFVEVDGRVIDHIKNARANFDASELVTLDLSIYCDDVKTIEGEPPSLNDAQDAARYRWLRAGNGYSPEENYARGGEDLDKLCDEGIANG